MSYDQAIVGRDEELGTLDDFLDRASRGPSALVLEGEAGIGKTTLWRWTLARAGGRGFTVLSATPAATETALSFAALDDLLEPVIETVLPQLAGVRRTALEAALLRSDTDAEPHAVAAALRDTIRILSDDGPLLVAIDDVQWIDRPSASVLAFALRRLGDARVGVLLARRSATPLPAELERAVVVTDRVAIQPLSIGALHRIISGRLELNLPRPVLRRIADTTGGNPFFALEIGRALQRRGATPGPSHILDLPHELHEIVRDRILAVPHATRDMLAAAAALSAPTTTLVGGDADALRAAVDAGLLEFAGERLRFTHPLLRSAALGLLLPDERRALHARLSQVVSDPEERARQLALSVDRPDARVAATLDEAASAASRRGAAHAAAELCELALHLTPPEAVERARARRLAAVRHCWRTGDAERARALADEAVTCAPAGHDRARALVQLAVLLNYQADVRAANSLLRQALEESRGDLELEAAVRSELALNLFLLREDLPEAEEHARLAVEFAERAGLRDELARCLTNQGMVQMGLGREDALAPVRRAMMLEDSTPDVRSMWRGGPRWDHACGLLWMDRLEESTAEWRDIVQAATAIGDDGSIPYTLAHLALTRCLAGDLTEAATLAEEGHELSVQAGLGSERALELAVRAFIAAHRGEADLCRSLAGEAVAEGEQRSLRVAVITGRSAIALLELSLGDFAAAESQLAGLDAELAAAGVGNPGGLRFVPDYVQALVGLGELDRARAAIDRYEDHAVRLDRPAARASALRCRGLIAIAAGDAEGAQQAFAAALRQHERRLLPIDRARTLLAQGAALRRAKRKKAAREVLGQAHAAFTAHGTQIFAAAAARELSSIGGRASARGLTPSELRVAELVAAGRTNREVAAALFLAERTVEGHLSRVYSKLGVRSRTELSRALPAED